MEFAKGDDSSFNWIHIATHNGLNLSDKIAGCYQSVISIMWKCIETVVPELIRDALSQDTRIIDVYDFDISFKNDEAYISFRADTIFGETEISEVF